jgi:hypothetical protein
MYWLSAISLAALVAFNAPGQAAALSPEKATELLAKAWMVDNRCDVLGKEDRDDLTQFVARAEISVAEKVSVKAAQSAIAQGREQGKSIACDSASADMVRDVLNAARTADGPSDNADEQQALKSQKPAEPQVEPEQVAAVEPVQNDSPEPEAAAADESEPIVETPVVKRIVPKPLRTAKVQKPEARKVAAKKPTREVIRVTKLTPEKSKSSNAIKTAYGRTAENYYTELRCRRVSQRAINAMYARVLREHQQAVSVNGRNAVRAMLRAAENRAAGRSC